MPPRLRRELPRALCSVGKYDSTQVDDGRKVLRSSCDKNEGATRRGKGGEEPA